MRKSTKVVLAVFLATFIVLSLSVAFAANEKATTTKNVTDTTKNVTNTTKNMTNLTKNMTPAINITGNITNATMNMTNPFAKAKGIVVVKR